MLRMWAWKTGKSSVRQGPQQDTVELQLPCVPARPVTPNRHVIYPLQLERKTKVLPLP